MFLSFILLISLFLKLLYLNLTLIKMISLNPLLFSFGFSILFDKQIKINKRKAPFFKVLSCKIK